MVLHWFRSQKYFDKQKFLLNLLSSLLYNRLGSFNAYDYNKIKIIYFTRVPKM